MRTITVECEIRGYGAALNIATTDGIKTNYGLESIGVVGTDGGFWPFTMMPLNLASSFEKPFLASFTGPEDVMRQHFDLDPQAEYRHKDAIMPLRCETTLPSIDATAFVTPTEYVEALRAVAR